MAPPRKRSTATATISKSAIDQAASTLQALPAKEKKSWSLREAVTRLQEPISDALSRGYSYEEVAEMLAKQGINISVFSLKRYLSLSRSQSAEAAGGRGRGKTRRSFKASSAASASDEAPAQDTPAEAPKRRGKAAQSEDSAPKQPKAAAKAKPARASSRTSTTRGRKKAAES